MIFFNFVAGKKYPECFQYQWLTDPSRYRGSYKTHFHPCDSHLSGWYRFGGGAGTQMTTSCMSVDYCDTDYGGYLTGSHPSVSEGIVTRTVCFRCGCTYSQSIKVINCEGLYYVYELNGTPSNACGLRYCST